MAMTTMRLSLKRDDQVQVMAGRDRGKTGKIMTVYPKTMQIKVEKINLVKRHLKPSQQNPQGGILEKESPLAYSNVLLFCTKCNRGVRHGIKMIEASAKKGAKSKTAAGSKKVRFCRKCDTVLDQA